MATAPIENKQKGLAMDLDTSPESGRAKIKTQKERKSSHRHISGFGPKTTVLGNSLVLPFFPGNTIFVFCFVLFSLLSRYVLVGLVGTHHGSMPSYGYARSSPLLPLPMESHFHESCI